MNPNMAQFRSLYQVMSKCNDPKQMFEFLAKTNPKYQPIVDMLNNGMSPEQMFYSLCQQRGVNPQEFLKNITG